jgi:hypothetical protein
MRSQKELLTEALKAKEEGRADEWWATLSDDERELWWQMAGEIVKAAWQIVKVFQEWLRDPLIDLIERWADWYEGLPEETRKALEGMDAES